jgi:hypothetical protein
MSISPLASDIMPILFHRNHFELALLVQSILMILAQVRCLTSDTTYVAHLLPAGPSIYMHSLPTKNKPRSTRRITSTAVILAMANLHAIYRVSCWFDVRWASFSSFLSPYVQSSLCQAILFLIFGRSELFVSTLGFLALGLESTLPIPQLIR